MAASSVSGYGDPNSAYDNYSSTGLNKPETKKEVESNNTKSNDNEDSGSSAFNREFHGNYDLGANEYISRFNKIADKVDRSVSEYFGHSDSFGGNSGSSSLLGSRDYTVGYEVDFVPGIGFEAFMGIVYDAKNILDAGITISAGPAIGWNFGEAKVAGSVKDVEGFSWTVDINYRYCPTIVFDESFHFSGLMEGYGPGAGISGSFQYGNTIRFSDLYKDVEPVVNGIRDGIREGFNRFSNHYSPKLP